jgi:hypothetical protein
MPASKTSPALGLDEVFIMQFEEAQRIEITYRKGGVVTVCRGEECAEYLAKLEPSTTDSSLRSIGLDPVEVAKLDKKQDVRCAPIREDLRSTTSTANSDDRKAATQAAFDSTFQRNRIATSTWQIIVFGVKTKVGLNSSYTFTMTFADGGKEDFIVTNITASATVEAKEGTLKTGSGQVEPKSCATS